MGEIKNKKGFTLIEIMGVISIIAVLFILLIPNISNAFEKTRVLGVQHDMKNYETALKSFFLKERKTEKTAQNANEYLDEKFKFDENGVSKKKNPFGEPYKLKEKSEKSVTVITKDKNKKKTRYFTLTVMYNKGQVLATTEGFKKPIYEENLNEFALEGDRFDEDGDGIVESWDTNGDGEIDAWDRDGDGKMDAWDKNGDGIPEVFDTNKDGEVDAYDTNYDGVPDAWDSDGDGAVDGWDTDGDEIPDKFDFDGDGVAEAWDTDKNGKADSYDTDGDGKIDSWDKNENGKLDAFDTNGDGKPDTWDKNEDGKVETFDLNKNGIPDAWDSDGDQKPDQFDENEDTVVEAWDTDNDQKPDAYDKNGNGIPDSFDTNGDGEIDKYDHETLKLTVSNSSYQKAQTVTIESTKGDLETVRKQYVWTNSSSVPTEGFTDLKETTLTRDSDTGTYYLHIQWEDDLEMVHNQSISIKLDNQEPVVVVTKESGETYKQQYETILTTNDSEAGLYKTEYQWTKDTTFPTEGFVESSTGSTLKTPVGKTGEYYLHIKSTDKAGNVKKYTSDVFKIDNTVPTVEFNVNGNSTYKKEQESTINVKDPQAGVDEVQYVWTTTTTTPATGWQNTTANATIKTPSDITGTYYLHIKATDKAGNTDTYISQQFNLDNTPPVSKFSPNGNSTYAKGYSTTLNVTDALVNVDEIQYVWTNSTTKPTSGWTTMSSKSGDTLSTPSGETGNYYLHVKAKDALGNESYTVSNVFKLDNTIPTISFSSNSNSTYSTSHSVTLNAQDAHSGVAKVEYAWTTSTSTPSSYSTTSATGTVTTPSGVEGIYYLHTRVTDNAGNSVTKSSGAFYVDNVKPTVSFSPNSNTTFGTSRSTTINAYDNKSSISKIEYAWSTSTSVSSYGSTVSNGGTVYTPSYASGYYYLNVRVTDSAGNVLTASSSAFYLDNSSPYASFSKTSGSYAGSHTVQVNAYDSYTSVSSVQYAWSSSTSTPSSWSTMSNGGYVTTYSTAYLHIRMTDSLGNIGTTYAGPYYIDTTSPTISITPDGTSNVWKATSVNVSVKTTDGQSGMSKMEYQYTTSSTLPTSGWRTAYTTDLDFLANYIGQYYLHVRATDYAGNVATKTTSSPYNIDNSKPLVEIGLNGSTEWHKTLREDGYTIALKAHDPESGTTQSQYAWSTSTTTPSSGWINFTGVPGSAFTVPEKASNLTGLYYLHVRVTNGAGTSNSFVSSSYKYDNTAPFISSVSPSSGTTYKSSAYTVVPRATDEHSGVRMMYYVWNKSATSTSGTEYGTSNGTTVSTGTTSGSYYLHVQFDDKEGNLSSYSHYGPYNVDTTAPALSLSTTSNSTGASTQSTYINYSDSHSGIKNVQYSWTTSSSAPGSYSNTSTNSTGSFVTNCKKSGNCPLKSGSTSTKYYLHVLVTDKAGNTKKLSSGAFVIK